MCVCVGRGVSGYIGYYIYIYIYGGGTTAQEEEKEVEVAETINTPYF